MQFHRLGIVPDRVNLRRRYWCHFHVIPPPLFVVLPRCPTPLGSPETSASEPSPLNQETPTFERTSRSLRPLPSAPPSPACPSPLDASRSSITELSCRSRSTTGCTACCRGRLLCRLPKNCSSLSLPAYGRAECVQQFCVNLDDLRQAKRGVGAGAIDYDLEHRLQHFQFLPSEADRGRLRLQFFLGGSKLFLVPDQ